MHWECKTFSELSTAELYSMLRLRSEVFVVEQNCVYLDLDGRDQGAYHVLGKDAVGEVVAYTRLFAPGDYYEVPAIGRVVVRSSHRMNGQGYELMERSLEYSRQIFKTSKVKIGAQKYLRKFYENLGFEQTGEEYMEDGIPHIHMVGS